MGPNTAIKAGGLAKAVTGMGLTGMGASFCSPIHCLQFAHDVSSLLRGSARRWMRRHRGRVQAAPAPGFVPGRSRRVRTISRPIDFPASRPASLLNWKWTPP